MTEPADDEPAIGPFTQTIRQAQDDGCLTTLDTIEKGVADGLPLDEIISGFREYHQKRIRDRKHD